MDHFRVNLAALAMLCAMCAGCGSLVHAPPPDTSGLLQPPLPSGTAVAEIYFVRLRGADTAALQTIWPLLDEQAIERETRERLAAHGFRLAITGSQLPQPLEQLLQLTGQETEEKGLLTFDEEQKVTMRRRHLHRNRPIELVASSVYESLPMMILEDEELIGKSFPMGQGILSVKSSLTSEGDARMVVTPEVQYGEARQTWGAGEGEFTIQSGRGKYCVESLRTTVTLRPGQSLVFAASERMPGSLGAYFFTQPSSGQIEHKLIVLRLVQSQLDNDFVADLSDQEP